jgi:hypothetical protein
LDRVRETGDQPGLLIHTVQQERAEALDTAPPSKSARTVNPAMAGNRGWLGTESFMGGLV